MKKELREKIEAKNEIADELRNTVFVITTPTKIRGKNIDKTVMEVTIEGDRMFARTTGNDSISAKIDVTVLWHFFKQVIEANKS